MRALRLVTEIDDGVEGELSQVEKEGNKCENLELGSDTVMFLDPQTLLKMILGFHQAKEGSDYEIATRSLKKLCVEEAIRRLDIEYRTRGGVKMS